MLFITQSALIIQRRSSYNRKSFINLRLFAACWLLHIGITRVAPRERSLRIWQFAYERVLARLRMRKRVTVCGFATTYMSTSQAYSRGRADTAFNALGACDLESGRVCVGQVRAIICFDISHRSILRTSAHFHSRKSVFHQHRDRQWSDSAWNR